MVLGFCGTTDGWKQAYLLYTDNGLRPPGTGGRPVNVQDLISGQIMRKRNRSANYRLNN